MLQQHHHQQQQQQQYWMCAAHAQCAAPHASEVFAQLTCSQTSRRSFGKRRRTLSDLRGQHRAAYQVRDMPPVEALRSKFDAAYEKLSAGAMSARKVYGLALKVVHLWTPPWHTGTATRRGAIRPDKVKTPCFNPWSTF